MQSPGALPVSAIVAFLREVLEANELFSDLWVVGEVSGYTRSQAGHRYLALRDANASLRTVLFRDTMPGLQLKDGDRVLAHGRLSIYVPRGELQFVCDFVRPEGVGIIAAKTDELKARLEGEGLFAPERKRPLPRFPRTIGVVTSPAGAALQDIRNVLGRRWPLATLLVAPASVQGPEAPAEIATALRALGREPGVDVIIVARGGGARETLEAFNTEAVARAVFASPVPVVSGVGHEIDTTICDLVADVRAPTPSAAAERAAPDIGELHRAIALVERAAASAAREQLGRAAARVDATIRRVERGRPDLAARRRELERLLIGMGQRLESRVAAGQGGLDGLARRIDALNPAATLRRGYAIVQQARTRRVVTSVRRVRAGDRLAIAVSDGVFSTEVC
jgi:exodeoxyribonuclease VII large subunit